MTTMNRLSLMMRAGLVLLSTGAMAFGNVSIDVNALGESLVLLS